MQPVGVEPSTFCVNGEYLIHPRPGAPPHPFDKDRTDHLACIGKAPIAQDVKRWPADPAVGFEKSCRQECFHL